jgi:hypothetical protein
MAGSFVDGVLRPRGVGAQRETGRTTSPRSVIAPHALSATARSFGPNGCLVTIPDQPGAGKLLDDLSHVPPV